MLMVPELARSNGKHEHHCGNQPLRKAADFFLLARTGATLWGGFLLARPARELANWRYATGSQEIPLLSVAAGTVKYRRERAPGHSRRDEFPDERHKFLATAGQLVVARDQCLRSWWTRWLHQPRGFRDGE